MSRAGEPRWRLVRADREAVPDSVRRFGQRARRRRLRAAARWGAVLLAISLLASVGWALFSSSLFAARSVRVTGVSMLTADQVHSAAAVPLGTPLARLDLGGVQRRVAALPQVESVLVERDWPRSVTVRVRERTAVAAVPRGRAFVLVDAGGVVFARAARPDGLPVVRLATPGPEDLPTLSALRVLGALPESLARRVSELVVDSPARISLALRDGRTVVWGDSDDSDRKARTALVLLRRAEKRIDVSTPDAVTVS